VPGGLDEIVDATTAAGERVRVRRVYAPMPPAAYRVPSAPVAGAGVAATPMGAEVVSAIASYWPDVARALRSASLAAAYVGVRPKLSAPGRGVEDFVVSWAPSRAVVALLGIESPGLTSSLAIGARVAGACA
jgi:hypothetical protein